MDVGLRENSLNSFRIRLLCICYFLVKSIRTRIKFFKAITFILCQIVY